MNFDTINDTKQKFLTSPRQRSRNRHFRLSLAFTTYEERSKRKTKFRRYAILLLVLSEILRYKMSGIYNHNSKRHCGSIEQNGLRGKVSNAIEQAKRLFDSLCTIIWIEARNIYVKMNRLSQHSSVGNAAVAVIKIAVIMFMIIVAVETIFFIYNLISGCFVDI